MFEDKQLPYSQENEAALLSCILQDAEYCFEYLSIINPSDFFNPAHRKIFKAFLEIQKNAHVIDFMSLTENLESNGLIAEIGGDDFITNLYNVVPTVANVSQYAEVVENYGRARGMIKACMEITEKAYDSGHNEIPELLDKAERDILDVSRSIAAGDITSTKTAIDGAVDIIYGQLEGDVKYCGYPTGYFQLDQIITGVKPGEMIVIGARPSVGKTALGGCLAKYWARAGYPVYFASLEMSAEQLMKRLVLAEAGINDKDISQGKISKAMFMEDIVSIKKKLEGLPISWDDSSRQWPGIKRRIRSQVSQHGCKIAIIDYLQLIRMPEKYFNREAEVAAISTEIKLLCQDLQIPILVLAQLNRGAVDRLPQMHDLRESGAIEQDADGIWLLHRDPNEDDETQKLISEGNPVPAKLIVAKYRNGPTGIANLLFYPQFTRFDNAHVISDDMIPVEL